MGTRDGRNGFLGRPICRSWPPIRKIAWHECADHGLDDAQPEGLVQQHVADRVDPSRVEGAAISEAKPGRGFNASGCSEILLRGLAGTTFRKRGWRDSLWAWRCETRERSLLESILIVRP